MSAFGTKQTLGFPHSLSFLFKVSVISIRYISINWFVLDFFTDTTSFQMKAPIIVYGHGDVSIFESVEYAEQYLEPIDVKNKEYVVYDSKGHLLKLTVSKKELPFIFGSTEFIETVRISAIGSGSDRSNELRKLLIKFFQETRAVVEESDLLSLRELVNKSVSIYGFSQ